MRHCSDHLHYLPALGNQTEALHAHALSLCDSCSLFTAFHLCYSSFCCSPWPPTFHCLWRFWAVFPLCSLLSSPHSPYPLHGADCTSLIIIPHNVLLSSLFPHRKLLLISLSVILIIHKQTHATALKTDYLSYLRAS